MRAQASVVAVVVAAEEAVVVAVLLLVTFVAWAVEALAAAVVAASGVALLRVATEVVATALLLVVMLLLLLEATAAAVAATVEATATHPALVATPGGKRGLRCFTIQPARDPLFFTIPWAFVSLPPTACFAFPTFEYFCTSFPVTADRYGNLESYTPFSI